MRKHLYNPQTGGCSTIAGNEYWHDMGKRVAKFRDSQIMDIMEKMKREDRERVYNTLFIGQTRRMKPLSPPLIAEKV